MRYNCLRFVFGLFCLLILSSSCTNYKKIPYFVGLKDTTFQVRNEPAHLLIQKGDQLSIFVSCSDPMDALIYNQPNFSMASPMGSSGSSSLNNPIIGYIVNGDGYIMFPKIGMIKVIGMKEIQLQDTLQRRLLPYLKDPQVSIRLLNYKVSVLGEVNHPGMFVIPYERITILEAIGMAGDLTINGRRDNVLLIRRSDSVGIVHYLNLQDKNIIQSPYYYLQPGDVIYVTPNRVKANTSDEVLQLLPIALSAISTLIVLLAYLYNFHII